MTTIPSIATALMGIICCWQPGAGLLLLLSGYILQDREFAYWHISTPWAPIYVTEAALAGYLLNILFRTLRQRKLPFPRPSMLWILFILAAAQSVSRGLLAQYPLPELVRDSALCYYALFALWTVDVADEMRRRNALRILGILVTVRALCYLWQNFAHPILPGQDAAMAMYFSFALIFLMSGDQILGRPAITILLGVLFSIDIFLLQVRTAWLALGLLTAFSFAAGYAHPLFLRTAKCLCGTLAAGLAFAYLIISLPHSAIKPTELGTEIHTLTMGRTSPNINTRLHLWLDAVEQILGTGLARNPKKTFVMAVPEKGIGDAGVARYYAIGTYYDPSNPPAQSALTPKAKPVIANSLIPPGAPPPADVSKALDNPHRPRLVPGLKEGAYQSPEPALLEQKGGAVLLNVPELHDGRLVRTFFGIPFGYPFLPAREEKWFTTQRFDPHNSLIAYFYRTGLLGVFALFCIVIQAVKKSLDYVVRDAPLHREDSKVIASALCVLYVMAHALTDVTLETPFKGVFLWIFLGLLYALFKTGHSRRQEL